MKKILLLFIAISGFSQFSFGQAPWKTEGVDIIPNFSMKDINNTTHSLYTMTGNGQHVIIDFSATWCGPCWTYHQSHVLQKYHEAYGPGGTVVHDGNAFFWEADPATNDLTTSTLGDWTAGVTHPMCDDNVANNIIFNFWNGSGSLSMPEILVVCKDNTFYRLDRNHITLTALRSSIESKCGVAPLSNSSYLNVDFEYDIYPNPAINQLNIDLRLDKKMKVSYDLLNTVGQSVASKDLGLLNNANSTNFEIKLDGLSSGIYLLKLKVNDDIITRKVVVDKQ